jgi:hypothetical protein
MPHGLYPRPPGFRCNKPTTFSLNNINKEKEKVITMCEDNRSFTAVAAVSSQQLSDTDSGTEITDNTSSQEVPMEHSATSRITPQAALKTSTSAHRRFPSTTRKGVRQRQRRHEAKEENLLQRLADMTTTSTTTEQPQLHTAPRTPRKRVEQPKIQTTPRTPRKSVESVLHQRKERQEALFGSDEDSDDREPTSNNIPSVTILPPVEDFIMPDQPLYRYTCPPMLSPIKDSPPRKPTYKRSPSIINKRKHSANSSGNTHTTTTQHQAPGKVNIDTCTYCHRVGHAISNCRTMLNASKQYKSCRFGNIQGYKVETQCLFCDRAGHSVEECTTSAYFRTQTQKDKMTGRRKPTEAKLRQWAENC